MRNQKHTELRKKMGMAGWRKHVAERYASHCCNKVTTASALGVSQPTLYRWLRDDPKLAAEFRKVEHNLYGKNVRLVGPSAYWG